jgi:hypothetical protein
VVHGARGYLTWKGMMYIYRILDTLGLSEFNKIQQEQDGMEITA